MAGSVEPAHIMPAWAALPGGQVIALSPQSFGQGMASAQGRGGQPCWCITPPPGLGAAVRFICAPVPPPAPPGWTVTQCSSPPQTPPTSPPASSPAPVQCNGPGWCVWPPNPPGGPASIVCGPTPPPVAAGSAVQPYVNGQCGSGPAQAPFTPPQPTYAQLPPTTPTVTVNNQALCCSPCTQ